MAFVIGDRVLETWTGTGVGSPITLAGAVSGYRAFSSIATTNGDQFYYQIAAGSQWEVGIGTRNSATTMTRTTILASSAGGAAENFVAGVKEVWMDATAEQLRTTINLNSHPSVFNGSLLCSVAANAATFALRTAAGAVPSANDPVFLIFQTITGVQSVVRVTAALSITVAAGATLGFINGFPGRVWLAVLLNGTTPELVVRNCKRTFGGGLCDTVQGFGFGRITTTAQAGAADDSALTNYSVTARTNVPFFILGFFDWDDTPLATAGNWANVPDKTIMMGPGVALPGALVQVRDNTTTTQQNNSTVTPVGVVGITITRSSKCNIVEIFGSCGSVLTQNSGTQARINLTNLTLAYSNCFSDVLQASGTNYNFLVPVFLYTLDDPSTVAGAVSYQVTLASVGTATQASAPGSGTTAWIRLSEVMS